MNEKIKEHLVRFCTREGFGTDDDVLQEVLLEADEVYSKEISQHRWWVTYFTVVRIDGMLIGFTSARTTGDNTPSEAGWEFDPSTICEVEAHEKTVIVYEPKE